PQAPDPTEREQRLSEALAACLEAVEEGQPAEEALARHPEFGSELRQFLADRERVRHWTAPLRSAGPNGTGTTPRLRGGAAGADFTEPDPAVRWFGPYELLEKLGQGGMAVVYKARQSGLGRLVALKMLRADIVGSEDDLRRFRNEIETVAQLDHANI